MKKNNGYSSYERRIARNVKFRLQHCTTLILPHISQQRQKNEEKTQIGDFILMLITKSYRAVDSETVKVVQAYIWQQKQKHSL